MYCSQMPFKLSLDFYQTEKATYLFSISRKTSWDVPVPYNPNPPRVLVVTKYTSTCSVTPYTCYCMYCVTILARYNLRKGGIARPMGVCFAQNQNQCTCRSCTSLRACSLTKQCSIRRCLIVTLTVRSHSLLTCHSHCCRVGFAPSTIYVFFHYLLENSCCLRRQ
jgi:hypothetical protein